MSSEQCVIRPWFYDSFVCTAAKCTDNCCIGWEIDIDGSAMERFGKVTGKFGERLRSAIHEGDPPTFAFAEGDRCALLREDGLCELILNCGEDILCDICALHPRFFNEAGGVRECGLGLCCEEVCRLLFSSDRPMRFIGEACGQEDEAAVLRSIRENMYAILQDRSLCVTDRLGKCAEYGWSVQQYLESGTDGIPDIPDKWESIISEESVARLLETLHGMESINGEWSECIERLLSRRSELLFALPNYLESTDGQWRYEHIAVYTLFRHFIGCADDGAAYARTMLACGITLAVLLTDCMKRLDSGSISEWDRILTLKLISKQVEYSQENIDAFIEEYY